MLVLKCEAFKIGFDQNGASLYQGCDLVTENGSSEKSFGKSVLFTSYVEKWIGSVIARTMHVVYDTNTCSWEDPFWNAGKLKLLAKVTLLPAWMLNRSTQQSSSDTSRDANLSEFTQRHLLSTVLYGSPLDLFG